MKLQLTDAALVQKTLADMADFLRGEVVTALAEGRGQIEIFIPAYEEQIIKKAHSAAAAVEFERRRKSRRSYNKAIAAAERQAS